MSELLPLFIRREFVVKQLVSEQAIGGKMSQEMMKLRKEFLQDCAEEISLNRQSKGISHNAGVLSGASCGVYCEKPIKTSADVSGIRSEMISILG
jgi:hypothetical protein